MLYGLAAAGRCRRRSAGSARTRTPVVATVAAAAVVFVMGVLFPLELLARVTSMLALLIFALVNVSLLRVRRRASASMALPRLPAAVPALGFLLSLGLSGFQLFDFLRGLVR